MKKLVLLICLILLIGLTGFVLADNFNIHYRIAVDEGWNLLQGFGAYSLVSNFITGGDITNQDVVAIFAYLPNENKYVRIYPKPEVKVDDEVLLNSAFWVYLKKSGWIEYNVEEEWASANNRNMIAGWNFVGITPDMLRLKVSDWKGDCNIEKIAGYQRGWEVFDANEFDIHVITLADQEQDLGRGVIVKVLDNCKLGTSGSSVNPPIIPN
ncbi:MAG: hypothetical protein Q7S56_04245 [Nanoarchaeota archaeon]|nr:hypothetical protein [Nanoarchaeota archaeon]